MVSGKLVGDVLLNGELLQKKVEVSKRARKDRFQSSSSGSLPPHT